MKQLYGLLALLMGVALAACSQEQRNDKKVQSTRSAAVENSRHNGPANLRPGPGLNPGLGAESEAMQLLQERELKGKGPDGIIYQRLKLRKGGKPLSAEELKKKTEIDKQRREQQLADARKNIGNKDDELRLQAVSHLDTDNADDLMSLEKALTTDSNSEVREEAAVQLSDGDPKVTVPALLNALSDPEPGVALAAIESLSKTVVYDKSEIAEAFKNLGDTHQDEEVRDAAQSALENMQ